MLTAPSQAYPPELSDTMPLDERQTFFPSQRSLHLRAFAFK
jgi:hypothetical protein